jgi:hypothetical protein
MSRLLSKEMAVESMVKDFNAVSLNLVKRAMKDDIDNWREITPISKGDQVYYDSNLYNVASVNKVKFLDDSSISDDSRLLLEASNEFNESLKQYPFAGADFIYLNKLNCDDLYEGAIAVESFHMRSNELTFVTEVGEIKASDVKYIKSCSNIYSTYQFYYSGIKEMFVFDGIHKYFEVYYDEVENSYESIFPMWNTVWAPSNINLYSFIDNHLMEVAECGFRIFRDEEDDEIYLGIDGMGYSFVKNHWEPLYDAMGLKWHAETVEA